MLKTVYETLPKHYQDTFRLKVTNRLQWSNSTFYRKMLIPDQLTPLELEYVFDVIKKIIAEAITALESSVELMESELRKTFKRV